MAILVTGGAGYIGSHCVAALIERGADVVVVDDAAEPLLVAECKAPGIPVGRQTLAQAVRYNSVLKARYVVLTNGLKHYCCELRDGEYVQLGAFPRFGAR